MKREEAIKCAEALVAQMTVEERASQLRYDSPAIPRLGIPEYNWWNEGLHGLARGGTATVFPQAIGMAAMFDPELMERIGSVVAEEARAKYNAEAALGDRDIYKGLTIWSPNINIFRDPRWGRGHETYGEDPYLTATLGTAYVNGLQGHGDTLKTAACAKHFAVHSGPEELRHKFDALATKRDMFETYLPAFEALVNAGVESVMGAYNRVNGEPSCGSETLLKDILRGKWQFKGHVVSDCWAVRDFHEGHRVTAKPFQSAAMALKAGCDINCGCSYQMLMKAYHSGLVKEEDLTRACVRAFTTRYMLGIMGNGSEYDSIPFTAVESPEHIALAETAALKSCVLLKNDGILPLNAAACGTVGVIGPNANSRVSLIGNYHGTASRYITVLEGVQDYLAGRQRVLYSLGCPLSTAKEENLAKDYDRLAEAVAVAQHSDTVLLVLGLDETLEGEEGDTGNSYFSGDKKDLLLPAPQRKLMDTVLALGKPTVVILMAGSSIDLSAAQDKANGILLSWYPGAQGGKAVAKLLFGEASPSGKLPVTFYKNAALEEMPAFTDYSMENRTYRYYTGEPLYPFGFGLTYGDCRVKSYTADLAAGTITAVVENAGSRATEDVLQVYVKDSVSPFAPPNPSLAAFRRISLQAGEAQSIVLPLNKNALTVVNGEGERIPGSGSYEFVVTFG